MPPPKRQSRRRTMNGSSWDETDELIDTETTLRVVERELDRLSTRLLDVTMDGDAKVDAIATIGTLSRMVDGRASAIGGIIREGGTGMSVDEAVKIAHGLNVDSDVDGIASDIRAAGITDIDDMDEGAFQAIVKAHDESGKPSSLAALRADAGMTQKELADAVGVGQGRMSEWESGRREMSATACIKVARALGVDPGRIVEAVATAADEGK